MANVKWRAQWNKALLLPQDFTLCINITADETKWNYNKTNRMIENRYVQWTKLESVKKTKIEPNIL